MNIADETIEASSATFRQLCGLSVYATLGNIENAGMVPGVEGYRRKPRRLVGELSMARPDEFDAPFDFRGYLARIEEVTERRRQDGQGKLRASMGPTVAFKPRL